MFGGGGVGRDGGRVVREENGRLRDTKEGESIMCSGL